MLMGKVKDSSKRQLQVFIILNKESFTDLSNSVQGQSDKHADFSKQRLADKSAHASIIIYNCCCTAQNARCDYHDQNKTKLLFKF